MARRIEEVVVRECCQYEDLVFTDAVTGRKTTGSKMPHWRWNQMVAQGEVVPHCKHCLQIHEFYTFTDAAGSQDWAFRETGTYREKK